MKGKKASKAAEIVHAVPAPDVSTSAVPFIAESKDEVVRGFQDQLRAIQLDSKAKHEEVITRLDEIKRLQTEGKEALPKTNVRDAADFVAEKRILTKRYPDKKFEYPRFSANEVDDLNARLRWLEDSFGMALEQKQRLEADRQQLREQIEHLKEVTSEQYRENLQNQERARFHAEIAEMKKHNNGLIKHTQELRQVNHTLTRTVAEQDQMIRKLMAEQLPAYPDAKETNVPRHPRPENGLYEYDPRGDIETGRVVQRARPITNYPNTARGQAPTDIYQYLGNCNIS